MVLVRIQLVPQMIKHFLGHKLIQRVNQNEKCLVCIECKLYVYNIIDFNDKFYYFPNEESIASILNISCDEVIIKKLLE